MADKTIICAPLDQRSSPALSEPSPALNSSRLWSPTLAASQSHPSSPSTRQDGDVDMADAPAAGPAEFKKPLDINSLMSPPELAPFENFSNYSAMRGAVADARADKKAGGPKPLLSPPISPFTRASNTIDPVPAAGAGLRDPILYPSSDIASSPPQPLFGPDEQSKDDAQQLVDEHVASRPANLFRKATPPEREDYELALFFKSAVMEKFANNPKGWLRKEREFLRADRKASAERRSHLQPVLPAKEIIARGIAAKPPRPAPRASKADKIVKPRARPAPQRIAPQRPSPQRIAPLSSTTPPNHASTGKRLPSATPEPRSRPVAPSREDKDFHLLPDYCPPLSSLPNKPNSLKIDWKGNPLDLSNDPHRHLLHPDELQLAASLRLDCATYLTSKRRIFMSRLECATKPKEFRKTDAQQACKIDVNKASKLWTAYDKVDWLNLAWMKPHLAAAGK